MAITANNTTLTFNDATTQTTSGVTAVNVSTGISSSGGKTPTLTNTGVTSAVAGTGVSVSGSTGAVTFTNSGVTSIVAGTGISISGGTGAVTITNSLPGAATTLYAIGSYVTGRTRDRTTSSAANSTLSGNSLSSVTMGSAYWDGDGEGGSLNFYSFQGTGQGAVSSNAVNTGTWRCMTPTWANNNFGFCGLWVRIS